MQRRLLSRNYLLLFQGQLVSQIGTQVFTLVALYWVMKQTDSSFYMGLFMLASTLPWVIFAPIGGAIADRTCKKNILVWSDFLAGAVMLITALVFFADYSITTQLTALIVAAALVSTINAFFQPTVLALLPEIVLQEQRVQSNALIQGTEQGAKSLGFALGGAAYAVFGAPLLLLINGLSFIFSAVSELFLNLPTKRSNEKISLILIKQDLIIGMNYVVEHPGLIVFFVMTLSFNFLYAPFMVLLPMFLDKLDYSALDYGLLMAIYSVGQLCAFGLSFGSVIHKNPANSLQLSLVLCPLALLSVSLVENFFLLAVFLLIQGAAIGMINVLLISILQSVIPVDKRARVFGILKLVAGVALPFGMLVAGIVASSNLNAIKLLFAMSSILMLLTVICFRLFSKKYIYFLHNTNRSGDLGENH